ncbi:hypothetical protein RvY_08638 [Ramazzottius varieornatus]|uniref:Chromo domain-containing protein n=1 Tax=Ramazzottius varieornatus TaxID=947166 RepID=A0A1D1V6J8_RAMVA|nr:hypothetical protein RvY_08638 [Ramazzottius varieornatus]
MDSEPEYSVEERSSTRPNVLNALPVSTRIVTQKLNGAPLLTAPQARKTITQPNRRAKDQVVAKILPVFSATGSENDRSRDSSVSDKQNRKRKSVTTGPPRAEQASSKKNLRPRSRSHSTEEAKAGSTSTQAKEKETGSDSSSPASEGSWEVKRIVGKKWLKEHKDFGYHVEWVGDWPLTWEPKSLLKGSKEAIREFEERQEERTKKKNEPQSKKLSPKKRPSSGKRGKRLLKSSSAKKKQELAEAHEISLIEKNFEMSMSPSEEVFQKVEEKKLANSRKSKDGMHQEAQEDGGSYVEIVQPGYSAMELSEDIRAINIIAHKPKQLVASALHELDFLVNYSAGPQEFVPYEVCLVNIPAQLCKYLAVTPVVFNEPNRSH